MERSRINNNVSYMATGCCWRWTTGNFIVDSAPTPANNNVSWIWLLQVAGGGAGGGAGGFREGKTPATPYTASPLVAPAGLPVSVQTYPISIGAVEEQEISKYIHLRLQIVDSYPGGGGG